MLRACSSEVDVIEAAGPAFSVMDVDGRYHRDIRQGVKDSQSERGTLVLVDRQEE